MPRLIPKLYASTPEQEQRAIQETERELTQVIAMMKRLDLPMTAFETVSAHYHHNLSGMMQVDHEKEHAGQRKKAMELDRLRSRIAGIAPPMSDAFSMSEEEIDAEIARLRKA